MGTALTPNTTDPAMPRYVAFLRGVSPVNAKMTDLKRCFEEAGFTDVRTVLSSGNVVFDSRSSSEAALERQARSRSPSILDDGWRKCAAGITSSEEVLRVTRED